MCEGCCGGMRDVWVCEGYCWGFRYVVRVWRMLWGYELRYLGVRDVVGV